MTKAPKLIKPVVRLVLTINRPITKAALKQAIEQSIPPQILKANGDIVDVVKVAVQKIDFD